MVWCCILLCGAVYGCVVLYIVAWCCIMMCGVIYCCVVLYIDVWCCIWMYGTVYGCVVLYISVCCWTLTCCGCILVLYISVVYGHVVY